MSSVPRRASALSDLMDRAVNDNRVDWDRAEAAEMHLAIASQAVGRRHVRLEPVVDVRAVLEGLEDVPAGGQAFEPGRLRAQVSSQWSAALAFLPPSRRPPPRRSPC